LTRILLATALALAVGCGSAHRGPRPTEPRPAPEPAPVKKVDVEIVVAAWAEPSHLLYGGGDAQILVRVQKRGGAPFPDVEVSLSSSDGTLFSSGHILSTDARGMTRDRLTTRRTTTVTLNAGGTRYSFLVPVDTRPE
jgi:hypothetical protein